VLTVVSIWVLANVAFGLYALGLYLWSESGRRRGSLADDRQGPLAHRGDPLAR
jgi:hypothetical protein